MSCARTSEEANQLFALAVISVHVIAERRRDLAQCGVDACLWVGRKRALNFFDFFSRRLVTLHCLAVLRKLVNDGLSDGVVNFVSNLTGGGIELCAVP